MGDCAGITTYYDNDDDDDENAVRTTVKPDTPDGQRVEENGRYTVNELTTEKVVPTI